MSSVTEAARKAATAAHARRTLAGIALMVVAVMGWAVVDAIAKALSDTLGPVQISWARFAFMLATVLLVTRGRDLARAARALRTVTFLRAVLPCGAGLLGVWALGMMPLPVFTAVIFASPLMVTALSAPLLGERPGVHRWGAVVVGFLGILVVARPWEGTPQGDFALGIVLTLGMSLVYALYQILNRKLSGRDEPPMTLVQIGLVGTLIISAAVPFDWVAPTVWQWALLVASGVVHAGIQLCLVRAFMLASASTLAPFNYVQIIAAVAFSTLIFGEPADLPTLVGSAIVVASGLYSLQRERRYGG
jgi:drug/metabolite transporter (DMT)-like permease